MIQPNMAKTLAYIFTDADLPNDLLKKILKKNITTTFHAITLMVIQVQMIWFQFFQLENKTFQDNQHQ